MTRGSLIGHGCSTGTRTCQHCGFVVSSKGIGSHERACKRRRENDAKNADFEKNKLRAIGESILYWYTHYLLTQRIFQLLPMQLDCGSLSRA